jgi:geranylgeranyl diphosphate synthase type I
MIPTAGVSDALARSRRSVGPAMTEAVDRLAPDLRRVASYHFGWTDAAGNPVEARAGKGVRPALALLSSEAVGAEAARGVPGAVAVELVHNFSLIHDDIIDGDAERHNRPTVWAACGVGPAIIVGDALVTLAQQVLLDGSSGVRGRETGPRAAAALAEATATMIAGQADDIAFEDRDDVTVEECLAMAAAKTGALLGCASSIGAILAGAPPTTVDALRDYGWHLGLAFQAVDDLLGIWGDPARTGKPAGSDLRQRKKSMPIVSALAGAAESGMGAAGGADAAELRGLVCSAPGGALGADAVERAAYLVEACGGRQWTEVQAKTHLDAALEVLEQVPLATAACLELADLAVYVTERES